MENKVQFASEYILEPTDIVIFMLGRIQNETVSIAIDLASRWNYIDSKLANKLQLAEEEVKRALTRGYDDEINNLELNIDEYSPKCNFFVLQTKEVDVVLGNSWLKSVGTFTMNVDKKHIEFKHLTNKIMLRDINSNHLSLSSNSDQNEQQNHTELMEKLKKNE